MQMKQKKGKRGVSRGQEVIFKERERNKTKFIKAI